MEKLRNSKILKISMLQPHDMLTYVCVSGGYSILILKFLRNKIFERAAIAVCQHSKVLRNVVFERSPIS